MAEADGNLAPPVRPQALARELSGDLPCIGCSYNLRGLSVRSLCPECGLAVRATLLSVVDPHATELQPIHHPRIVYSGLVLWIISSIGAVSCTWAIRLMEYVAVSANAGHPPTGTLSICAVTLWICAGLGVLTFCRPHDALPRWATPGVFLAAAGYFTIAAVNYYMLIVRDNSQQTLYVTSQAPEISRTLLRIIEDIGTFAIILGMSTLWGIFQSRSVLMRSGRLDRQSAPSMYAAAGIVAAGDLLWLAASPPSGASIDGSMLRLISQSLVAVGSMLLSVGLMAILLDVVRLKKVILAMPLSLDQVTRPEPVSPPTAGIAGLGGSGGAGGGT